MQDINYFIEPSDLIEVYDKGKARKIISELSGGTNGSYNLEIIEKAIEFAVGDILTYVSSLRGVDISSENLPPHIISLCIQLSFVKLYELSNKELTDDVRDLRLSLKEDLVALSKNDKSISRDYMGNRIEPARAKFVEYTNKNSLNSLQDRYLPD